MAYLIYFPEGLQSGDYRISVKDDAGNQNEEGLGQDVFRVDVDLPSFATPIRMGTTDIGRNTDDKLTNIKKARNQF